jgi:DNA polymerase-3 subunit beta
MKFSVVKEDILQELQLLQGIVEKRNTMPILANILVSVLDREIELTGTDLEVGLRTYFSADISEQGAMTVSGKKLFEIVRSLAAEQEVTFSGGDDLKMEIKSGASEFKVLCLHREDYPQVPDAKFERNINLPLDGMQEMIERVYFAITQEQRYYLNGALMILKGDSVKLVSTDGHRLAYTSMNNQGMDVGEEIRGIVSKKALGEMRKFENGTIAFDLDENNLFFRVGKRTLISRIIEGKFPNYEAVIPKDNPHSMLLARDLFIDAIRRVSLLSTERSRGVKFMIAKNKLELYSSNPEIGEARDMLEVEYSGDDLEIGFNSQYLLDFLSNVKGDRVEVMLKDENSAVLMRPAAEDDIRYEYVIMPMKI